MSDDILDRAREGFAVYRGLGKDLINEMISEIKRLQELLKHADDTVIWEHTRARPGFQEEIEAVLGIGEPTPGPAAGEPPTGCIDPDAPHEATASIDKPE